MRTAETIRRLPAWWRFTLVALATLILCSCQALPLESGDGRPAGQITSTRFEEIVADDLAPPAPPRAKASEFRQLGSDQSATWRSQGSKEVAAGWAMPARCNCSSRGSDGVDAAVLCTSSVPVGPPDEYLCDGGDFGLPAAVRADWSVDGLEQEDAIAHYDTLDGRVVVTPSNRVCVYAPRFAAVRHVENLIAHERRQLIDIAIEDAAPSSAAEAQPVATSTQRHAVAINLGERPASLFRSREQATEFVNLVMPGEFNNTLGPYANVSIIRTGQMDGRETAIVKRAIEAAVAWNGDQAAQVVFSNRQAVAVVGLKQPGTVYQTDEPGDPRLRLVKLASTHHALPGEEVEFTLRFDNIGDQTIGNVTIIDNLTTRLEYVPETAKSTLPASFSSVPNGAGSNVLRWEINDPIKPGAGGVLQFRAAVQ